MVTQTQHVITPSSQTEHTHTITRHLNWTKKRVFSGEPGSLWLEKQSHPTVRSSDQQADQSQTPHDAPLWLQPKGNPELCCVAGLYHIFSCGNPTGETNTATGVKPWCGQRVRFLLRPDNTQDFHQDFLEFPDDTALVLDSSFFICQQKT